MPCHSHSHSHSHSHARRSDGLFSETEGWHHEVVDAGLLAAHSHNHGGESTVSGLTQSQRKRHINRVAMLKQGSGFMSLCTPANFKRSCRAMALRLKCGRKPDSSVGFRPAVSGTDAGRILVIDGGDETAAALASSGLLEQVQLGLRLGLVYPGFMIPTHAGYCAAEQEMLELPEDRHEILAGMVSDMADLKRYLALIIGLDEERESFLEHLQSFMVRHEDHPPPQTWLMHKVTEAYSSVGKAEQAWQQREGTAVPSWSELKLMSQGSQKWQRLVDTLTELEREYPNYKDTMLLDKCLLKLAHVMHQHQEHVDFLIKSVEAPSAAIGTGLMFWALAVFEASALAEAAGVTVLETALSGVASGILGAGQLVMAAYGLAGVVKGGLQEQRLHDLQCYLDKPEALRELNPEYQKLLKALVGRLRVLNGVENTLGGAMVAAGQFCMFASSVQALTTLVTGAAGATGLSASVISGLTLTLLGTACKVGVGAYMDKRYHVSTGAIDLEQLKSGITEEVKDGDYHLGKFREVSLRHAWQQRQALEHRLQEHKAAKDQFKSELWFAAKAGHKSGYQGLPSDDRTTVQGYLIEEAEHQLKRRSQGLDVVRSEHEVRSDYMVDRGRSSQEETDVLLQRLKDLGVYETFVGDLLQEGYLGSWRGRFSRSGSLLTRSGSRRGMNAALSGLKVSDDSAARGLSAAVQELWQPKSRWQRLKAKLGRKSAGIADVYKTQLDAFKSFEAKYRSKLEDELITEASAASEGGVLPAKQLSKVAAQAHRDAKASSKAMRRQLGIFMAARLHRLYSQEGLRGKDLELAFLNEGEDWQSWHELPQDLMYQDNRRHLRDQGLWSAISSNPLDQVVDQVSGHKQRRAVLPIFNCIPAVAKATRFSVKKKIYFLDEKDLAEAMTHDASLRHLCERSLKRAVFNGYKRRLEGARNWCDNYSLNLMVQAEMVRA